MIGSVKVPKTHLVPGQEGFDRPTVDGTIVEIIQAVDGALAKASGRDGTSLRGLPHTPRSADSFY